MSEPKKYWMSDAEGAKALVVGAEARDFWSTQGWAESGEPEGEEFVWLQHNVTGGRQKFTAAAVQLSAHRDWYPSDPPAPVNLAVAHRDVIEPPAPPTAEAEPKPAAAASPKTTSDKN